MTEFLTLSECLPSYVRYHPGLLSLDDRRLYYALLKEHYQFAGSIVDLGAFLGSSAVSMDKDDLDEQETLLDVYKRALGMCLFS